MENLIHQALQRWKQLSGSSTSGSVTDGIEDLVNLMTGPSIDRQAKLGEGLTIKVKLSNSRTNPSLKNTQRVFTCDGHLFDVPADGNCGFHAICKASYRYGGKTILGTDMPLTQQDCRTLLVQFITKHQSEIEDVVVNSFGIGLAKSYLWNDVHGHEGSGSELSHSQLCKSLANSGMMGHWFGAGIGEAEIHLLGRGLGVTVHCVMAALTEKDGYCLRQTFGPYSCLWTGSLNGTPKGAVVIRFMGSYQSGHYQIVNAGCMTKTVLPSPVPQKRKPRKSKRGREVDENELERDIAAVDHMNGVQPQTKN